MLNRLKSLFPWFKSRETGEDGLEDEFKSQFEGISEPRASFTVVGFENDGRIKVEFDWNKPFIEAVNKLGFMAETEEDTVQLFFYASAMRPMHLSEDINDLTAPEVQLSDNGNRLVV